MYKYGTYKNCAGNTMVVWVENESDKTIIEWNGKMKKFDTFEAAITVVIKTGYIYTA